MSNPLRGLLTLLAIRTCPDFGACMLGVSVSVGDAAYTIRTEAGLAVAAFHGRTSQVEVSKLALGSTTRLEMFDEEGRSVPGAAVVVRMPFRAPEPVLNLAQVDRQRSSVKLRWDPPLQTGGAPVLEYRVYVASQSEEATAAAVASTTECAVALHKLSPGTAHVVAVVACNAHGVSEPVAITAGTGASVPEPPVLLPVAFAGEHAAHVAWVPPERDNGAAVTEYRAELARAPDLKAFEVAYSGPETHFALPALLSPGSELAVRVRARNAQGWSQWSATLALATPAARRVLAVPTRLALHWQDPRTKAWRACENNVVPLGRVVRASWQPPAAPLDGGSADEGFKRSWLLCRPRGAAAAEAGASDPVVLAYTLRNEHELPRLTRYSYSASGELQFEARGEDADSSDWAEQRDEASGLAYYVNAATLEQTWDPPARPKRFYMHPGQQYELTVRAETPTRSTEESAVLVVAAARTWPNPPVDFHVHAMDVLKNRAVLSWSAVLEPDNGGDAIVAYTVQVRAAPPAAPAALAAADPSEAASAQQLRVFDSMEACEVAMRPPEPARPPVPGLVVREKVDAKFVGEWFHATVTAAPQWHADECRYLVAVRYEGYDEVSEVPAEDVRRELFPGQAVLVPRAARPGQAPELLPGEVQTVSPAGYWVRFTKHALPIQDFRAHDVQPVPAAEEGFPAAALPGKSPAAAGAGKAEPAQQEDKKDLLEDEFKQWAVVYEGAKTECVLDALDFSAHKFQARVAAANATHGPGPFSRPVLVRPTSGALISKPSRLSSACRPRQPVAVLVPAVYDDLGSQASHVELQAAPASWAPAGPPHAAASAAAATCQQALVLLGPFAELGGAAAAKHATTSVPLADAQPGSLVCVRVRGRHGSNTGPWSDPLAVQVPASAPAKMQLVRAENVEGRGVVVAWTRPNDHASPLTRFLVHFREAARGAKPAGEFDEVDVGLCEETLLRASGDFAPGTRFDIRVQALNALGASPLSDTTVLVTEPLPPSAPATPRVWAHGGSAFEFELSPPKNDGGAKVDAFVVVCVDAAGAERRVRTEKPKGVFDGLKPDTAYEVFACAVNKRGSGPASPPAAVVTGPAPLALPAPAGLSVLTASPVPAEARASTTLHWRSPNPDGDFFVVVQAAEDKRPVCELRVSRGLHVALPDSAPGAAKLRFRVQQKGQGIESPFSEWCGFTSSALFVPAAPRALPDALPEHAPRRHAEDALLPPVPPPQLNPERALAEFNAKLRAAKARAEQQRRSRARGAGGVLAAAAAALWWALSRDAGAGALLGVLLGVLGVLAFAEAGQGLVDAGLGLGGRVLGPSFRLARGLAAKFWGRVVGATPPLQVQSAADSAKAPAKRAKGAVPKPSRYRR